MQIRKECKRSERGINVKKLFLVFVIAVTFLAGCGNDPKGNAHVQGSEISSEKVQEDLEKAAYLDYYTSNFGVDCMDKYTTMHLVDLTHDGIKEMIVVQRGYITYGEDRELGQGDVYIYTQDAQGTIIPIWDYQIYDATFLYITRIEGEYYLLQYFPRESHGSCTFYYKVFSLTDSGEEIIYKQVEADEWFPTKMEAEEFKKEVDAFLNKVEKDLNQPFVLAEYKSKVSSYYK